ncbi:MAG TPA: HAMP domain-containing sensor histidine kinase [Acidimicrobiales bacterium]|nr:HAMP domain-containing sensor histidine kinase [Acidimicrobiales bacterium]
MTASVGLDELAVAALVVAGGRVAAANQAAAELAGARAGELVGVELAELLGPPGAPSPPSVLRGGEEVARLRRIGGGEVAVALCRRSSPGEAAERSVVTLRPIQPPDPSGMEVVSTVSHELRSPLTSVKGYTSLLLSRWDRLPDDQRRSMLEQVHHDADRVTRLVNELLDISRLETGHLHLRFQEVALPSIASSVVAKVALEYPDLECGLDFAEGFPSVEADPDKVEQVLTNLVENAAKYASLKGMSVSGSVRGDAVAVAVSDAGEGIPDGELPHVFTKFYRRDQGRPSGSGLGLWISRGLVEAHGGRLEADSVLGRGSVFRFTLPLERGNGR